MSDFNDVKPYTQAELDQQAIWANEFDQWWEDEGQYQRAGGGQYERSFAWWAWLNREQKQQTIINDLKHQKSLQELEINQISQSNQEWQRINSELQKRVDDCAALAKEWRTLAREMCPLDDKYVIGARLGCAQDIEEVLRGES